MPRPVVRSVVSIVTIDPAFSERSVRLLPAHSHSAPETSALEDRCVLRCAFIGARLLFSVLQHVDTLGERLILSYVIEARYATGACFDVFDDFLEVELRHVR